MTVYAPPGHFYSPIVNPDDIVGLRLADANFASPDISGVTLDSEAMARLSRGAKEILNSVPFSEEPTSGHHDYFKNDFYSSLAEARVRNPGPGAAIRLWVKQAMQMHDEIAHLRVIDASLRGVAPGCMGLGIIWIDADDIERLEIGELDLVERRELAAEHEMQQLPRAGLPRLLCRHDAVPILPLGDRT